MVCYLLVHTQDIVKAKNHSGLSNINLIFIIITISFSFFPEYQSLNYFPTFFIWISLSFFNFSLVSSEKMKNTVLHVVFIKGARALQLCLWSLCSLGFLYRLGLSMRITSRCITGDKDKTGYRETQEKQTNVWCSWGCWVIMGAITSLHMVSLNAVHSHSPSACIQEIPA